MRIYTLIILFISFSIICNGQQSQSKSSAEIFSDIQKLNFLGSVLHIAAHPDDENTRMLSYLSNEIHAKTAYLSLTRGDGGQNRIGPELRELLGVIRTQELLAARRIDGAEQFFSRANDFGYSKIPDETIGIWNEDLILEDVVWTIRNFKPDIIINRFDHRTPGTTHGHHTASAILSYKAFDAASDDKNYPDQLKFVEAHKTERLFYNMGTWLKKKLEEADKSKLYSMDFGVYYPLEGLSNTEIAATSRSQHQCQGMGTKQTRGAFPEYLELLKGSAPEDKLDIFSGINTIWSRLDGGEKIGEILAEVENGFNFRNPSESIPKLVKAYKLIQDLPDSHWKKIKEGEIKSIIVNCAGLFIDATTNTNAATYREEVELKIEVLNRSNAKIALNSLEYQPDLSEKKVGKELLNNQVVTIEETIKIKDNLQETNPFWLNKQASLGSYVVDDRTIEGLPETPRELKVKFYFDIESASIEIEKPITYKHTDPTKGEIVSPFEIVPEATVNIESSVYLFGTEASQKLKLSVKSFKDNLKGTLNPGVPNGWKVSPEKMDFTITKKGATQTFEFELSPPKNQNTASLNPFVLIDGKKYDRSYHKIDYDHIPTQIVLLKSTAKTVRLEIETVGKNIGYIMGAGDVVPQNLEQIGFKVNLLEDKEINAQNLKNYDAVIVGIRAYNVREAMKFNQAELMNYVKDGGTLIVQYNTNHNLLTEEIGPYPMTLSKDRVTVEGAEVSILKPDHPLLNHPNKITSADFEGWVQERGLYFPNEWDENYETLFSCNDPNESAKKSGFLYCKYGDGHFIYTGYSWFRQLPAGVPGAFRIFANMIGG